VTAVGAHATNARSWVGASRTSSIESPDAHIKPLGGGGLLISIPLPAGLSLAPLVLRGPRRSARSGRAARR
jgi:hypothetical protein